MPEPQSTPTTPSKGAWGSILDDNPESPNAPITPNVPQPPAGGGNKPASPPQGDTAPPQPQGGQPPTGASPAPTPPATPPNNIIQMDDAALERLVSGVVNRQQPAQPGQPARQYTEAELDQLFNVYKVASEHLAGLGIEATPERVQQVNQWLQGAARQAATVAEFRLMQQMQELKDQLGTTFGPALAYYRQQEVEGIKTRFYKEYPNLKDFEPILLKVRDSMQVRGLKFKSEAEAFKAVAEEASAVLKAAGVTPPAPGAPANAPANQPTQTPSGMPTLSGGGQGGAGDLRNQPQGSQKNWQKALGD